MFDDPRWGDDPRDRDDERWPERDRDSRDLDPRDVFMRDLDLPRGREREVVHDARDREYTLRGSETRTLSTVGAFRFVPTRELRDHSGREADPRNGDLRHLADIFRFKAIHRKGRQIATVNRALATFRAAINWGRFQDPPYLTTTPFIDSTSASK